MSKRLAELLMRDRIITDTQYKEALEAVAIGANSVQYLVEKKYVSESKLVFYLSQKYNLPSINILKFEIKPEVLALIPPALAQKCQAIPIQANQGVLIVAVYDPTNLSVLEDIKFATKMNVEAVITPFAAFDAVFSKHYGGVAQVAIAVEKFKKNDEGDEANSALDLVEVHNIDAGGGEEVDAPTVKLVNSVLSDAIRKGASDIHVEPFEKHSRIRLRIDGILHEIARIPMEMKRSVTARFKIMSRMDISESRIPQDGRIKLRYGGKEVDFRVSSMPTLFGEKMVLRILSRGNLELDLAKLGFEPKQLDLFKKGIHAPNGMVLVTGPTGSGKTTTLYSGLLELNKVTENISTAEDPVEYNLDGINQVQIHKEIGLTFANVLRTLLRQDPDIILVGEIRDFETAEVATQAALTGHLVLSTLHTNDAPSTITRLTNMGIEPFLVVASVNTIIAQRLLRTICPKCKIEKHVPKETLMSLGFSAQVVEKIKTYTGGGCSACGKSGYKGRVAIYEILDFTPTLKELLLSGATTAEMKRQAIKEGMKTLRMSALTKVAEGKISLEEALALTAEN